MKRPADLRPLVDAYRGGKTQHELAARYGVCVGTIQNWLRYAETPDGARNHEAKWLHKNLDRISEMARMYRDGMTLCQIGETYGVTRERIRQLLTRVGISAKEGGASVLAQRRRRQSVMRRKCAQIAKYGMTPAERQALIENGATRAYIVQKNNAAQRGIEWRFTLKTWWEVWEASGKWDERGRGNGYVMARHGDVGPYAPDNVKIIHSVANLIECYERMGKDCSKARAKYGFDEEPVSRSTKNTNKILDREVSQ